MSKENKIANRACVNTLFWLKRLNRRLLGRKTPYGTNGWQTVTINLLQ